MDKMRLVFEEYLKEKIQIEDSPQKKIYESINYSLLAGGKRIRPIICMKMYERFSGNSGETIIDFASAIEMIHTYSLIHDDLPAMDNDDYRRGKLTNHKVFKEDIAILAGDGLLNMAYETMLKNCLEAEERMKEKFLKASLQIAQASGIKGMIGGQVVDILSERKDRDRIDMNDKTLDYIHINKTSKLIEASLVSGAILGGANEKEINFVEKFGRAIGLIFQIRDDILDKVGNIEKLGKMTGTDDRNKKLTYVSLYGLEESEKRAKELAAKAKNYLNNIGGDLTFFENIIDYSLKRES